MSIHLWQFMLVTLSGWINRHQQQVIEYLKEENRVLRELQGKKRLRFTAWIFCCRLRPPD